MFTGTPSRNLSAAHATKPDHHHQDAAIIMATMMTMVVMVVMVVVVMVVMIMMTRTTTPAIINVF